MVTVEDAFTDAWRSFRIRQGDDPATLPDPLGRQQQRPKRKQRKGKRIDETVDSGGGFFAAEEGEEGDASLGGGFVVDEGMDDEEHEELDPTKAKPQHIPLSSIPDALASLSLPTNDEFVLDLFAQTAVHINNDPRRRRRGASDTSTEKMVSLDDFRRVAQVPLEGEGEDGAEDEAAEEEDEQDEQADDAEEEEKASNRRRPVRAAASSANKRRRRQIQQEEAEVEPSDDEDAYSEGTAPDREDDEEAAEYSVTSSTRQQARSKKASTKTASSREAGRSATGGVRRSRKKARKEETTATDENDEELEGHLNATQRRTVHAAFRLFTDKLQSLKGQPLDAQPRLGRDDLKLLVKHIGEKIPEKEIDEMIDEGARFFAKASSRDVTRQSAKLRRDAAAGRAAARGEHNRSVTIGIDEFAGILLQGRLI